MKTGLLLKENGEILQTKFKSSKDTFKLDWFPIYKNYKTYNNYIVLYNPLDDVNINENINVLPFIAAYKALLEKEKTKTNTEITLIKTWIQQKDYPPSQNPRDIGRMIMQYYHEKEKPFHRANMAQMVQYFISIDKFYGDILVIKIDENSIVINFTMDSYLKILSKIKIEENEMYYSSDQDDELIDDSALFCL